MWRRLSHLLLVELLAFATFVSGGLALLGAAVTWTGGSRHPAALSWFIVGFFTAVAAMFAFLTVKRWRVSFGRRARVA